MCMCVRMHTCVCGWVGGCASDVCVYVGGWVGMQAMHMCGRVYQGWERRVVLRRLQKPALVGSGGETEENLIKIGLVCLHVLNGYAKKLGSFCRRSTHPHMDIPVL